MPPPRTRTSGGIGPTVGPRSRVLLSLAAALLAGTAFNVLLALHFFRPSPSSGRSSPAGEEAERRRAATDDRDGRGYGDGVNVTTDDYGATAAAEVTSPSTLTVPDGDGDDRDRLKKWQSRNFRFQLMRRAYLRNNPARTKERTYELEFVHIPKTGGSAIALAASKGGVYWGLCKFRPSPQHCFLDTEDLQPGGGDDGGTPTIEMNVTSPSAKLWQCDYPGVWPWHCPPSKFAAGMNLYEPSRTFVVVRHPYDVLMSEYNWAHRKQRGGVRRRDAQTLNRWVAATLREVEESGASAKDGHCIPMHEYVYADGGRVRIVDHVLRYEDLAIEFPKLMHQYNVPVSLVGARRVNTSPEEKRGGETYPWGVQNLTSETLRMVNK